MQINHSMQQHRDNFPALGHKAYFNYGGQGTMPRSALEAINQAYEYVQVHGPFSSRVNSWLQEQSAKTRNAIAQQLNVPIETITLTENVTSGCNIALWGIQWQKNDHILMTDCEHPGVIAAVQEICRRFGVTFSTCPILDTLNSGDPTAVITKHLQPQTRLVVLSHLLWNTGQVLPLQAITQVCHDQGVQVLVDAAQSAGSLPLNLTEIGADYYAFTGHKWFCGPAGVGGLYVRPEVRDSLHPTFIGWRGITMTSGQPTGWKDNGQRFELATSAYPLYTGLTSAIAIHDQWGSPQERYERICQLSAYLWEQLSQREGIKCLKDSPPEAGLVSFTLPGVDHQQFVLSLEEKGFQLRTLADPDCIRACVHYFTTEEEIERLVKQLDKKRFASTSSN